MKKDYLVIENMEVPYRIGTTPQERAFPQVLKISVYIEASLKKAGTSDNLGHTIDYTKIIEDIRTLSSSQEFSLAERVAELIATTVLKHPRALTVQVGIRKKVFSGIESVGVSIFRKNGQKRPL